VTKGESVAANAFFDGGDGGLENFECATDWMQSPKHVTQPVSLNVCHRRQVE
jgi:hypothetical protein